jgi:protein-S-isoprenylcysteine O-methyltransferase Ste14
MPIVALALLALYGLLAFGVRMAVQLRRTGSSGLKMLSGDSSSVEWACGLLVALAAALCLAGLALQIAHALTPVEALDGELAHALGTALLCAGIACTIVAQLCMGDAWRIGVDPRERTQLVTHGPFAIVRNPIFACMIPAFLGVALLAPNPSTIAAAIVLVAALELQTRLVEEPYLAAVHGERYASYAARVGRFLPWIGRRARSASKLG